MVLVYAESQDGKYKKSALEAVTFAKKTAEVLGSACKAVVVGQAEGTASLGKYGASEIIQLNGLDHFDSQTFAKAISKVAQDEGAKVVIVADSSTGKSLLGRLAVRLDAGSVSAVNQIPTADGSVLKVKKNVFSGKAVAEYSIQSDVKVFSLSGNSLKPEETGADAAIREVSAEANSRVNVIEVNKQQGNVAPLPEAELVVSAGRGMKGPENWGIIEELAKELGATTACSRPVADTGWRPHHEHVGQTGVAIKPNLYIAAGISGAIQHLAGVNSSKCIVVINKDPEAPFFKAADYGICADLFEVVPRITEALKKAKG